MYKQSTMRNRIERAQWWFEEQSYCMCARVRQRADPDSKTPEARSRADRLAFITQQLCLLLHQTNKNNKKQKENKTKTQRRRRLEEGKTRRKITLLLLLWTWLCTRNVCARARASLLLFLASLTPFYFYSHTQLSLKQLLRAEFKLNW